jgi:endonuclease G
MTNEGSKQPLQKYVVSVDYLESITGINFFPSLPDSIESLMESTIDVSQWWW